MHVSPSDNPLFNIYFQHIMLFLSGDDLLKMFGDDL